MATPTKKTSIKAAQTATATKVVASKAVADDSMVSKSVRLRADQWTWLQEQELGMAELLRNLIDAARQTPAETAESAATVPATPVVAVAPAVEPAVAPQTLMQAIDPTDYLPGDEFHSQPQRVYRGELGLALTKRSADMARVVYHPAHENAAEEGIRRGQGRNFATWVFSEEHGLAEQLLHSGLELVIDSVLEPNASVGLHRHGNTEEIHYLLSGSLTMTTRTHDGQEHSETLQPGDAHLIRPGQAHCCQAGAEGARFLTVAARTW